MGRRVVVSEYPQRDVPSTEDMGRKAREWRLTAYVIGEEYLGHRDDWINLLEEPGPYTLVDPWGGEEHRVVLASPVRFRESDKNGGQAEFDLHLIEGGEDVLTPTVIDAGAEIDGAAAGAIAALREDFALKFDSQGLLQRAANVVFGLSSKLRRVRGKISGKLNQVENLSTAIDEFDNQIEALLQTPRQFVSVFSQLIGSIVGLFRGPTLTAISAEPPGTRVAAARGALQELFEFPASLPPVLGETPTRQRERQNQEELGRVFQVAALVESARVFATISFATGGDATDVKAETAEYFDELLDDEDTTDELYNALVEVRAFLVQHLDELTISLPQLTTVTIQRSLPALVLAHKIYGDVARADEIADLNKIKNPAFVPDGVPITVVSLG